MELTGATGEKKTLIQRSWEAAQAVSGIDRVVVATDDGRIRDAAEGFGAEVVMTSATCANGTERCAEAHDALGARFDMVVNLQGDAPLTPPWFFEELVAGLDAHPTAEVATPVLRASGRALRGFHEDRRAGRVGATTVVFGQDQQGALFLQGSDPLHDAGLSPIPRRRRCFTMSASMPTARRRWPPIPAGRRVRSNSLKGSSSSGSSNANAPCSASRWRRAGRPFWEMNNPEDGPRIETILGELGVV